MNLCNGCHHFKGQRNNKHMGHCLCPLPTALAEHVGTELMKRGLYVYVGQISKCKTFLPIIDKAAK